jgi:putative endonuclease
VRTYSVYILASRSRNLYVGVTSNLVRRLAHHRARRSEFTRRYRITRLVYVETTCDVCAAIAREKQIKGLRRAKKLSLIAFMNPAWNDLLPDEGPEKLQIPRCARDDKRNMRST